MRNAEEESGMLGGVGRGESSGEKRQERSPRGRALTESRINTQISFLLPDSAFFFCILHPGASGRNSESRIQLPAHASALGRRQPLPPRHFGNSLPPPHRLDDLFKVREVLH